MANEITYVGHATVLVDLDGVRLLTDPVLRRRVMHLRRVGSVPANALREIDAVLLSHGHWDHLDLPSLDHLGRELPVVCPRGLGPLLRRRRFEHVVEVEAGEDVRIGALTITATFAAHEGDRGPLGAKAKSVGYVIGGSQRIYFAGDTDLFDGMADLAPLDIALVPVAGWGLKVGPGHLDARAAAESLRLLRPRIAVPIHWGTYARIGRRPDPDPPEDFRRAAADIASDVSVSILRPGETLTLP
jgi:L-ascorbate metabolism protein UlaG (beta-lactamase superfamily)